jgi:hypothetical protein
MYLPAGRGGAIGLDVTAPRYVDQAEIAELDMKHPQVRGLWRAGQDYLMCGQVLAAASGVICALRMMGPVSTIRFLVRALVLLFVCKFPQPKAATGNDKVKAA